MTAATNIIIITFLVVIIVLLLVYSFKLEKKGKDKSKKMNDRPLPTIDFFEEKSEDRDKKTFKPDNKEKNIIPLSLSEDKSEKKTSRRKLKDIPDLSERIHRARQNRTSLRTFETEELKPADITGEGKNILGRVDALNTVNKKIKEPAEEDNYTKIQNLKTLSFQELILDKYPITQNLEYLEETTKLARYKYERGEDLKSSLEKLLSVECEKTFKTESTALFKRVNELNDYIKDEIEIKDFISEELQELIQWIKSLEANKSLELKILSSNLFNMEKDMILVLGIITKLEKQITEVEPLNEKLMEKWESLYSEKPCIFISS